MTIDTARPRQLIVDAICQVAPDVEPSDVTDLDRNDLIRDTLELDSMDQLNIAEAIHERCGLNIAESDYHHMDTLASFENYLREHLGD